MVDPKLKDAMLAFVIRRGESGAARDEFFQEFKALGYPELEEVITDLERVGLVEIDWKGPADFVIFSSLPGLAGSRGRVGQEGGRAQAKVRDVTAKVPERPTGHSGRLSGGGRRELRRQEYGEGEGIEEPGTVAARTKELGATKGLCPFINRSCDPRCMLYVHEQHKCAIRLVAQNPDFMAIFSRLQPKPPGPPP